MSQETEILSTLQSGRSLTSIQALQEFGCFRLAARINDLRYAGHKIITEMVRDGEKHYARYHLM
jgi:hypothetical protein